MIVGFTGTQDGMTKAQHQTCAEVLRTLFAKANGLDQFHHGDCVGADEEAHNILKSHAWLQIHIHPPEIKTKRAFCTSHCVYIYKTKPYLDRNHDIVDASPVMVAAPNGPEKTRSGTWATVRYARKRKRYIVLVWPSGETTEEG